MKRIWCRIWGHDNVVTIDLFRPRGVVIVCLKCKERAYVSTKEAE